MGENMKYLPDINGAFSVNGFDVQQTGAGDWRVSLIDAEGNYIMNEYFNTKRAAFRFAEKGGFVS